MDKETLSNYGWIVICVLVMAVMIALATPFGAYIKDAVWSTTNGLFDVNENALSVIKPAVTNLWQSEWTYGKYFKTDDSVYSDVNGCICESYITVTPGKSYSLQYDFKENESKSIRIRFYNSNKERVGNYTGPFSIDNACVFTVPENATFIRLGLYRSPGSEDTLLPVETTLYAVDELRNAGFTLAGKTLLNFGDSIAAGTSNLKAYAYQIAENNHMKLINSAVGGAQITDRADNGNDILEQVINADASLTPDVILFDGYTNDADEANNITTKLGTISDGFDAELDTSTFCGSFETIIKTLKEKYPNAKLIYVTTHVNCARDAEVQDTLVNLAIEMCKKWDVTVADIYHDSGLNSFDSDMFATYIDNGSHPNTLGYEKFYVPIIETKINEVIK